MNLWCAEPILDIEGMGAFLGHIFQKQGILFARNTYTEATFNHFYENTFIKTHCTRLGTIVASNKGLE